MKTRNGFVSNSSSSSFIVAFSKIPESKEELREMLFDSAQDTYSYWDSEEYPVGRVVEQVWADMQKTDSGPLNTEQIYDEFTGGYIEGQPERDGPWPSYQKDPESWEEFWKEWHEIRDKYGHQCADEFMKQNPNCTFF